MRRDPLLCSLYTTIRQALTSPLDRSIAVLHSIPEAVLAVVSPEDHWTDAAQAEHALQLAARMTPLVGELVDVLVTHWLAEAETAADWVTIDVGALPGQDVSRTLHQLGYLVVVIGNEPRPLVRVARIRSAEASLCGCGTGWGLASS